MPRKDMTTSCDGGEAAWTGLALLGPGNSSKDTEFSAPGGVQDLSQLSPSPQWPSSGSFTLGLGGAGPSKEEEEEGQV